MAVNPKLDRYIQDAMLKERQRQPTARTGIVADYNALTNTATVIMTDSFSDQIRDIIQNVKCPTTYGVQTVAPEPGRGCYVMFDGIDQQNPYIVSFHSLAHAKYDYGKQTSAYHGIPRHIVDL